MHWHLVHTKPGQEKCAFDNLQRQGYQCYLPTLPTEKLCQGQPTVPAEPLFPGYLFIRPYQGDAAKNWAPIRSTKGVSCLVNFGSEPIQVDDGLIELFRIQESQAQTEPGRQIKPGARARPTEAPFAGIEDVYQIADGKRRIMVLIDILSKPVGLRDMAASLSKAG